jgi:hypothetical protein
MHRKYPIWGITDERKEQEPTMREWLGIMLKRLSFWLLKPYWVSLDEVIAELDLDDDFWQEETYGCGLSAFKEDEDGQAILAP